ncbi:hypothetical protein WL21_04680 [Burkholderia ubonensis]|nr:hypothetical protein WJ81_15650 [Burkholderia ubonensis]KVZ57299.1 hypothetical protein WL20_23435 [Burkholderia ubonensis]KVZ72996.1 hypothetical protein WL21_04680 [Burkholderia ubonensis]
MYQNDIGTLVKDALCEAGCDAGLIGNLDQRATVEIAMKDAPTIYIGYKDESEQGVMIWAAVCEYSENLVRLRADRFLEILMSGISFGVNHQLLFREAEGELQISAEFLPETLQDSAKMADAIQEFFDVLVAFVDVSKQ